MVNEVVPEICPTVAVMTTAPGCSEPPCPAAGTVRVTVKLPCHVRRRRRHRQRDRRSPNFSADRFVCAGKPRPVMVMTVPVEAVSGDTVTTPVGTLRFLTCVLVLAKPPVLP